MPPLNKKPMTLPAASAVKPETASVTHLLTRIIDLIDDLVAVMEEEITLVEKRDRLAHAELLKRKQRLTLDYRASLKTFILEPDLLRKVPDVLRTKARAAGNRLAEASGRNARVIRAIMTASQRLVQSIVAIVKDEVLPSSGYTRVQTGSYSPTCKPVTIYKSA